MRAKVSVIVPIYNVEKHFKRCMDSLLKQTLYDIEIILVDDESPDDCPKLCDEYASKDSRIKVIHKSNGGLGFARNSGIEIATGEYVAYLDSDDYVSKDMYENLYRVAKENNADAVIGGFYRVNDKGEIFKHQETTDMLVYENSAIHSLLLSMIGNLPESKCDYAYEMSVWRGIYSNDLLQQYNIRFPSERVLISEDVIYHIDFFERAKKIIMVPDCFYYYCLNGTSLTKQFRKDRFEKDRILYDKVIEKLRIEETSPDRIRIDRFLLARARVYLSQVMLNYKKLGKKEIVKLVDKVINDSEMKRIHQTYPISRLPIQQYVFAEMLFHRRILLMRFLIQLNAKRKNKV